MTDSIFNTPMQENIPVDVQIGRDIVRQLIVATTGLLCSLDHGITLTEINTDDVEMAIKEAREWLGESEGCDDGTCRL